MSTLTLDQLAELATPAAVSLRFVPDADLRAFDLGDDEPDEPGAGPDFDRAWTEAAVLLEVAGPAEDLRATFRSVNQTNGAPYDWDAYVFEGHLAFGTGAELLQVESAVAL